MAATILATAGFAERTAAELQQEEAAAFIAQVLICVLVVSLAVWIWASLFRDALRSRQFSLRSLMVLVGLLAATIPVLMWTSHLIRTLLWL